MSEVATESLTDLCKRLEAFETPRWAIEAILDVELTTQAVVDPCCGLGAIGEVCLERGLHIDESDVCNWYELMPDRFRADVDYFAVEDFLSEFKHSLEKNTVIMNPPFSLAEEFVSRAQVLGARKIICFQRQAWRESQSRRLWWEQNSPARVWVCGSRATCWRFDLLDDVEGRPGGMHNSPTSYAWYVWERGHKGAEVTSAIYPRAKT